MALPKRDCLTRALHDVSYPKLDQEAYHQQCSELSARDRAIEVAIAIAIVIVKTLIVRLFAICLSGVSAIG